MDARKACQAGEKENEQVVVDQALKDAQEEIISNIYKYEVGFRYSAIVSDQEEALGDRLFWYRFLKSSWC